MFEYDQVATASAELTAQLFCKLAGPGAPHLEEKREGRLSAVGRTIGR
jgi:hypothetical protein